MFINGILNEDGTEIDLPENPLKEKWNKLYPPNQRYESKEDCRGYCCMYCDKCPHGSHWEIPEDDIEVFKEYKKQLLEYHKIHNPTIVKLMELED